MLCVIVVSMIHTIIMAGGKGTRFWPLSRAIKAKQFLKMIDQKPLIDLTLERLEGLVPIENRWIVGNAYQTPYLKQIPDTLIAYDHIFLETRGRNTAPCIAWAARHIYKQDPDAILIILPSDHWVSSTEGFQETLKKALPLAEQGRLVTIGIPPTSPHTGYGYIEAETGPAEGPLNVRSFTEKPDIDTATSYLQKGGFYWNAGMFVWKAKTILNQLAHFLPQNEPILDQIEQFNIQDIAHIAPLYGELLSISIDYAVMEKAAAITSLIPASFSWSDVGNWRELEMLWEKDVHGNAISGEALLLNSHHNIIYSEKKLVTAIDIDHLIIVDTADALMILPKASDQKIKDLYQDLPPSMK